MKHENTSFNVDVTRSVNKILMKDALKCTQHAISAFLKMQQRVSYLLYKVFGLRY